MDKYHSWLEKGLERLYSDYLQGRFTPRNERDIQCHLYHTLLEAKSEVPSQLDNSHRVQSEIHGPVSEKSSGAIDLALGRFKGKSKKAEDRFEPRLLIEIKKTSSEELTSKKEKELTKDINKLRKYKQWLQKNGKDSILRNLSKPVVVLFFKDVGELGIREKPIRDLEQLESKFNDIKLIWGPRHS